MRFDHRDFFLLILSLMFTNMENVVSEKRICRLADPKSLKLFRWNEVKWIDDTGLVYRMCLLIQSYSVGVDLTE